MQAMGERGNDTALHSCCAAVHNDVLGVLVNLLIERGANVNAKRHNGETPLHVAAFFFRRNHLIIILLKNGANVFVFARDNQGNLPTVDAVNSELHESTLNLLKGAMNGTFLKVERGICAV